MTFLGSHVLAPLHLLYWWVVRRTKTIRTVNGIDYVDLRDDQSDAADVLERLSEAIRILDEAGYSRRLREGIHLVAAMSVLSRRRGGPSPYGHALILPFTGPESRNFRLLACQLIWGAEYNRLFHEARDQHRRFDPDAAAEAAYDAQVAFVKGFPDAPDWLEYLQPQRPTPSK